jgi:hypothetical protein
MPASQEQAGVKCYQTFVVGISLESSINLGIYWRRVMEMSDGGA